MNAHVSSSSSHCFQIFVWKMFSGHGIAIESGQAKIDQVNYVGFFGVFTTEYKIFRFYVTVNKASFMNLFNSVQTVNRSFME